MTIIVYFDHTFKNKQIITPTKQFDGNVKALVEHLTHSNLSSGHDYKKNYYKYTII